ncbi:hypothetical protein FKP32DRAFT_1609134 [Trametes sanguinea]|nr:hypothetical protein FKP32DRAFT_1609134 [Trametes sanguinea]
MSIVTVNRAIVPTLWNNDLAAVASVGYDQQVRVSWRFVPETLNEMLDWATVVEDDEEGSAGGCRLHHLVYADGVAPDGDGGSCTVTLVLQGFLGAHAVGVLGNWRGKERDAQMAVQFLVLESGGYDVAFGAQVRALQNVRQLIAMRVGGDVDLMNESASSISLRRRVFTKVNAVDADGVGIELTDAMDPQGRARAMRSRWRVDHIIPVRFRRPNGSTIDVVPDALRRGDFVEVTATARIEVQRSRKRRGVFVQFEMHEIVRLLSAQEVKAMSHGPAVVSAAGSSKRPRVLSLAGARESASGVGGKSA